VKLRLKSSHKPKILTLPKKAIFKGPKP